MNNQAVWSFFRIIKKKKSLRKKPHCFPPPIPVSITYLILRKTIRNRRPSKLLC